MSLCHACGMLSFPCELRTANSMGETALKVVQRAPFTVSTLPVNY